MTVIKIGYQSFLIPDGVDASPILEILSHSLPCTYWDFQKFKCVVEDKEVDLKIHVLPKKCRFVRMMGEVEVDAFAPEQKAKPKARTAKTLSMPPLEHMALPPSQGTLFLEGPRK